MKYFKDQSSLKIFNTSLVRESSTMEEFLRNIIRRKPVYVYDQITLEKAIDLSDMGPELGVPSESTGYVFNVGPEKELDELLVAFKALNTNGNWLFITAEGTLGQIERFLRKAWYEYGMLYAMFVNFVVNDEGGEIKEMYYFDPFNSNDRYTRGDTILNTIYDRQTPKEKIQEYVDDFFSRTKNLRKYKLSVDIFDRPMYAKAVYNRHGKIDRYLLVEGTIIDLLSYYLNFEIEYTQLNTYHEPGERYSNGTVTHGMALIEYEKVNYSAVTRLLLPYGLKNTAYLYPFESFRAVFVVPKSYTTTKISLAGIGLFDLTTIIMVWVCILCCMIVRYIIHKSSCSTTKDTADFFQLATQIIGFQNGISQSISSLKRSSDRLIIISCLIIYLVVGNSYQGSILSQIRSNEMLDQINSLEELLNSDLELYNFLSVENLFKPDDNQHEDSYTVRNLLHFRMTRFDNGTLENACEIWRQGTKMGILMRYKLAKYIASYCYDLSNGNDLLYIVPESAASFHLTQTVPKSSPLISEIDSSIAHIIQSGFLQYANIENDIFYDKIRRSKIKKVKMNAFSEIDLIGLDNLQEAFMTLALSWFISSMILLLEIIFYQVYTKWPIRHQVSKHLRDFFYSN